MTTALLVVGLSSGYLDPSFTPAPLVEARTRAMRACGAALAEHRARGGIAAFAPRVYEADGSNVEFMRVQRFKAAQERAGRLPLQRGAPGTLEYPEDLAPQPDDIVVERRSFSAFFGTDLVERLRAKGVTRLVVIGANTGTCVRATVFDAIGHGFRTAVLANAHSDVSEESAKAAMAFFEKDLQIPILPAVGEEWERF